MTIWPWALKVTDPPQRAVTLLASPERIAVLPSVAVTELKFPMYICAELLLVADTLLKLPSYDPAELPFRAIALFPIPS